MRIIYIIILIVVLLIFYFSWIPDPNLANVKFMPGWLSNWTDKKEFEDIRTGVPLIILGFCTGLLPILRTPENIRRWFISWLVLIGVVFCAEVGQLLLPKRAFSWDDVGWGAAGALLGLSLAAIGKERFHYFWKR